MWDTEQMEDLVGTFKDKIVELNSCMHDSSELQNGD
jgi:hypothetical protein